ncbi:MAG: DUF2779 domain-containing protein, partial [Bdellovibrionota bacterium]
EVMVLNRDCRYPDLSNLFRQQDVTADVLSQQVGLTDKVNSFFKILDGDLPKINPGAHCNSPYRCPFVGRCCPQTPPNHISEFYRTSASLNQQLESQNLSLISDIKPGSESFNKLSPIQQRQVTTLLSGTLYSDHVGLKNILDRFRGTKNIGFLDFETIMPAIPVWDGCSPFEQVPVQFSAIMCTNGSLDNPIYSDYFPLPGGDPRELEAQSLVAALRDADVIFAYSSSMEGRCIRHLQNAVPKYRDELEQIRTKLVDLLPIVRNHVYHPNFRGSFSLKSVFPALLPNERGYVGLSIADGGTAQEVLENILFSPEKLTLDADQARGALIEYCRQDTLGLLKILKYLLEKSS